jgi:alpha-mannosidase
VLLNWVDVEDRGGKYGLALFCDHTTSYVHGEGYPLGLTVQYSGNGIFYRNYRIDGPTEIHYALLPHADRWDRAGVEAASARWNEPLLVVHSGDSIVSSDQAKWAAHSFLRPTTKGWEITSMRMEGKDLLVRIFNAAGDDGPGRLQTGFRADEAWLEELDGRKIKRFDMEGAKPASPGAVQLSIPRYGVRTIRFINART